jgi:hemerythrin superfamily protein
MDAALAHGAGKIKAIKARLEGLTGVFKTLAEQHGEVASLLERVRGTPEKRAELWPVIRRQLLAHERGEVRELYPVLRMYDTTAELADHHDYEARELEQMIGRLDLLPILSEAWGAQLDRLADTVLHHADEEETKIFPFAQEVLGEARTEELDRTVQLAQHQTATAI